MPFAEAEVSCHIPRHADGVGKNDLTANCIYDGPMKRPALLC